MTDGYVFAVDSDWTVAEAVAIRNKRIVYVGDNEGVRPFVGANTRVIDLQGRMLMPGLHDMHIHATGTVTPDNCDFSSEAKTLEEMVTFLKACITRYEIPSGEWLVALQWPFSSGNQPSPELPNLRAALDAVSDEHPIILWGDDGHHAAVNSMALAQAQDRDGNVVGISSRTLETVFADYREMVAVDAEGEPSGGLTEGARLLVRSSFIEDVLGLGGDPEDTMPRVAAKLASVGITSIQDPWVTPQLADAYLGLERSGGMTFRLRTALFQRAIDSHLESGLNQIPLHVNNFNALRRRLGNLSKIQFNGVKLFADAVLEGNPYNQPPTLPVAAVIGGFKQPQFLIDPESGALDIDSYVALDSELCQEVRANPDLYSNRETSSRFKEQHGIFPGQCERSSGILEHSEEFIREYVRQMTEAGFHVHIHALSDRGVRVAGDAFAAVKEMADQAGLTQSLAHVQLAHPEDQKRLGSLGVYMAFTYVWNMPDREYDMMVIPFIDQVDGADDLYNPDHYYMRNVYPVKSMQELGANLVFGSDAPVGSRDPIPFVSMVAALTREENGVVLNETQRLDIQEVIAAYTINGARLMGHDAGLGSIETGKIADLIVVDRNLVELATTGRTSEILETKVDVTIFDGEVVYERAGMYPGD
jgi:predicted amidohydrolase YtcJ